MKATQASIEYAQKIRNDVSDVTECMVIRNSQYLVSYHSESIQQQAFKDTSYKSFTEKLPDHSIAMIF